MKFLNMELKFKQFLGFRMYMNIDPGCFDGVQYLKVTRQ